MTGVNIFFDDATTGGSLAVSDAYYKLTDLRLTADDWGLP